MEALESIEKFNKGKDSTDLVFEKAARVLISAFLGYYQQLLFCQLMMHHFLSRWCMVEKME